MTACCLHNLRDGYIEKQTSVFSEFKHNNDTAVPNMTPLGHFGGFANRNGLRVREILTDYFSA